MKDLPKTYEEAIAEIKKMAKKEKQNRRLFMFFLAAVLVILAYFVGYSDGVNHIKDLAAVSL